MTWDWGWGFWVSSVFASLCDTPTGIPEVHPISCSTLIYSLLTIPLLRVRLACVIGDLLAYLSSHEILPCSQIQERLIFKFSASVLPHYLCREACVVDETRYIIPFILHMKYQLIHHEAAYITNSFSTLVYVSSNVHIGGPDFTLEP